MKPPLLTFSGARLCVSLLVFTALSEPSAWCGLPFSRTLNAIKARVGHVLHKIGNDDDEETSSSRYRQNQMTPRESDLEYGPPPLPEYQTDPRSMQRPQAYRTGDSGRNAPEILYSAHAGEPAIVLRKSPQVSGSPVAPVQEEKPQPADTGKMPALRDLPVKNNFAPQPSSSSSDHGSKNAASPSPVPINYARPVPGHPGFVYPPGVTEDLKNMLDVRGCASGEKMRDPRTGNVFLVP